MKPDFIVIGAMKCATSTVCAYLEDHPEVFMLKGEPGFFSRDENFRNGVQWYEALFDRRTTERLVGEGTNSYSAGAAFPDTVARMAAYHPGLKLIYLVRDPVVRIESHWVQNRADLGDGVPPTLDRAVTERAERYVDQSLYWKNLQRYRAAFPDTQIFVGLMEDLSRDPGHFFSELNSFLGIADRPLPDRAHVNPTTGKTIPSPLYSRINGLPLMPLIKKLVPRGFKRTLRRKLSAKVTDRPVFSPAVRAELVRTLRPDAEALLDYVGKPRDFWRL